MSRLIYIIAGEASGDALGAGLMRALKTTQPDVTFAGIGGEAMQKEGLLSLFPFSELSLMGFLEIIPHIPKLLRRLRETALDILTKKPDVVVTIDSPGFNFRLARALKNNPHTHAIKRVHYVAPTVWAYKPERARKTAELFDMLLTLLPFETPYFEREGLKTVFVGHPVLWENAKGDNAGFRARHSIAIDAQVLLILPGSRLGEVKRLLPLFVESAKLLPGFTPVIVASAQVKAAITEFAPHMLVVDIAEKHDAFAAANLALSKSGTITLELAVAGVPMVVAHKVNPISAWLARRWLLIKYASLVNIAVDKEIVPELIQEKCTVSNITQALTTLSEKDNAQAQREACTASLALLRGSNTENPNVIAAGAVLKALA